MKQKSQGTSKPIALRGLAPEIIELMTTLAAKNDRSVEAEFRQAIHQYVEPIRLKMEIAQGRNEMAQRLHLAHLTFLEARPEHSPKLSYLANAIGEERAGPIETWFDGSACPPFSALDKLAAYFGCSAAWLIHGDGQPYGETDQHRVVNPSV